MNRNQRMFRLYSSLLGSVPIVLGAALWMRAQSDQLLQPANLLPAGASMYLEARDFHRLLEQWNRSAEKRRWLAGANFDVLSRSRLLGRLSQAGNEFTSVAGVPLEMNFVDQVAGEQSAFAFYNLSRLAFVYLTHMVQGQVDATELWQHRASFQTRSVAGIPFYSKSDSGTQRTVSFASYKAWLVLASDQDRMAQTLMLLSGQKTASVGTEPWFIEGTRQAQAVGVLRLVYNLDALLPTPQFRTYWLQRNVSELKIFSSGISDLFERDHAFEEKRALLRKAEMLVASEDNSLSEALRYAPATISLYRAWARPDTTLLSETLQQVLFGERSTSTLYSRLAPAATAELGMTGSATDLETRIDQPPFERNSQGSVTQLVDALSRMQPLALLHVQNTQILSDQVFVLPNSGVVLICKNPDLPSLDQALRQTTSLMQIGSLDSLHVSVNGQAIILTRINLQPGSTHLLPGGTTYTAVYNHAAEWPHYRQLFALLDRNPVNLDMPQAQSAPTFFKGNIGSLGDALSRLQRASILSEDKGSVLRETVRYELSPP
jgi:hypothetical protein